MMWAAQNVFESCCCRTAHQQFSDPFDADKEHFLDLLIREGVKKRIFYGQGDQIVRYIIV